MPRRTQRVRPLLQAKLDKVPKKIEDSASAVIVVPSKLASEDDGWGSLIKLKVRESREHVPILTDTVIMSFI